ncbi:MAG TPA: carboxylate--amine ligase [Thermoanaerobaculia bacterium]|nr:carboxylate--amine ligase [Thermoanaerobaculia bacterium]
MPARRILVTGAGGSPSTNFVRSLRESPEPFYLIGVDCDRYHLQRAETDERHLVPEADDPDYLAILRGLIAESGAELIYSQPDQEILVISRHRAEMGARTYLPDHATIETCQDKFASFRRWKEAGLSVPETVLVDDEQDLARAFAQFGAPVWLRSMVSPGGGKGSFRAPNPRAAGAWLDFCDGWGAFTAAECLEPDSITWTALYHQGELVVAQGRKRLYWELGNRAPSGVTGITGTGVTVSDSLLDEIAERAVRAIDQRPHGIFAVDLTYDRRGVPNPTEINIGRFFTTHLFFTRAGLNLPYIFAKLAFGEPCALPERRVNPLPPGLAWVRGMDFLPVLTDIERIAGAAEELARRRRRLARE